MLHLLTSGSVSPPSVPPFYHGVARIAVSMFISGEAKSFIKSKVQVFPVYHSVKIESKLAIGNAKYITNANPNMLQLLAHQFPLFTIVVKLLFDN